jgi:hypothetical protein
MEAQAHSMKQREFSQAEITDKHPDQSDMSDLKQTPQHHTTLCGRIAKTVPSSSKQTKAQWTTPTVCKQTVVTRQRSVECKCLIPET